MPPDVPIRFVQTARFQRAYRRLEAQDRERVKKALTQFLADRATPGLRVKRVQGTDGIWEMRAGRDIRLTFELHQDEKEVLNVVLRNVGHHDAMLKNP